MDVGSWGVNEWVAVGSAAVALISFFFNWAVVQRQTAMQAEGLKAQMDADVLAWAHAAVDALSEAAMVAERRGEGAVDVRDRRNEILWRISALADRGRLFFPNLAPHAQGADKEGAFRGYRPPVLDTLVFAFQAFERMDPRNLGPDEATAQFLRDCRRAMVSELQRAIDPRRRSKMMRRLALTGPKKDAAGYEETMRLAARLDAMHPGVLERGRDAGWLAEVRSHATRELKKG
jgi:hypothetical protein